MFCVTVCHAGSCLRGRVFRLWLVLGCLALIVLPGLIDCFHPDPKRRANIEKGHKLAVVKVSPVVAQDC